jgi:uncharacterized protein YbbC (DUF1343 family)
MIQTGLDRFTLSEYKKFQGQKLGVLCNQASVTRKLRHISDCVLDKSLKLDVRRFFGPQHGIRGEKQDNMVESSDFVDPRSSLPIVSLYSSIREPSPAHIADLDTLLVDLQDIGCRVYTFVSTVANCMRAAKNAGKKIVVLDRPNPIGGVRVEGNVLEPSFSSFVGQYPIAMRHGMTLGELALLINDAFAVGCDLEVIHIKGLRRRENEADRWGRAWVSPSPNIPSHESARVFPATVLFEGTEISEGRGTTRPFEWIGAPFIDPDLLANHMNKMKLPGVFFRPIFFQPTYQKCRDQVCGGGQLHVTDASKFQAVRTGIWLIYGIRQLFGEKLRWKNPPYEYEYDRMPVDLIMGTDKLRKAVDDQKGLREFEQWTAETLAQFKKLRRQYLLY